MVDKVAQHEKAPPTTAPPAGILVKIIEKERELEQAILQAKEEANAMVQRAKDKAAGLVAAQRKAAESEAAAVREELLRKAREEAAQITKSYQAKLKAVQDIPPGVVDKTVSRLVEMVLPSGIVEGGKK